MSKTVIRCPQCDRRHPEYIREDDPGQFEVRIVSDHDAQHPDCVTHTMLLECVMCGFELGFAVNLAPSFDDLQTVENK